MELAFTINHVDTYNIYLYNNKLYAPSKINKNLWEEQNIDTALNVLIYVHKNCSSYYAKCDVFNSGDYGKYETKEQIIKRIKSDLGNMLLIDGVLYETIGFPFYSIYTFGLGGNHGGTALMPCFAKKVKKYIKNGYSFSPYDFDKANKKAIEVATNRKDTDYVALGFNKSITCHISKLKDYY